MILTNKIVMTLGVIFCLGYLFMTSSNSQIIKGDCNVAYFNTDTDELKTIGKFTVEFKGLKTIKVFQLPNSKLFATVGVSDDKSLNEIFLTLVLGYKDFKGDLDELKNKSFINNANVSLPLKSFEQGKVSSVMFENGPPAGIIFKCEARK